MRVSIRAEKTRNSSKTGFFLEIESTAGHSGQCKWKWIIKSSDGKILDQTRYEESFSAEYGLNGFWMNRTFHTMEKFSFKLEIQALKFD